MEQSKPIGFSYGKLFLVRIQFSNFPRRNVLPISPQHNFAFSLSLFSRLHPPRSSFTSRQTIIGTLVGLIKSRRSTFAVKMLWGFPWSGAVKKEEISFAMEKINKKTRKIYFQFSTTALDFSSRYYFKYIGLMSFAWRRMEIKENGRIASTRFPSHFQFLSIRCYR